MSPENDLELEEHHRIVRRLDSDLDRLLRDKQYGSLDDAYWLISRQALLARRKLRKVARERV
jgi:hypothetical protein